MSPTPEQQARTQLDAALEAAGWIVQDRASMNFEWDREKAAIDLEKHGVSFDEVRHGFGRSALEHYPRSRRVG